MRCGVDFIGVLEKMQQPEPGCPRNVRLPLSLARAPTQKYLPQQEHNLKKAECLAIDKVPTTRPALYVMRENLFVPLQLRH